MGVSRPVGRRWHHAGPAQFLNFHGYRTHGWKLGRNCGLHSDLEADMLAHIDDLFDRHGGRRISLVVWSLGGLYARQFAKVAQDKIRCVITLGSPFGGSPRSTNAWRVYEWLNSSRADQHALAAGLDEAPPVPTKSIFSRTDGICAWQTCVNPESPLSENIEIDGSHCGLGHHPAAVYAIADRLAQPEGAWEKFDRSGWRSFFFSDWRRA